jgi:hypothetical protein
LLRSIISSELAGIPPVTVAERDADPGLGLAAAPWSRSRSDSASIDIATLGERHLRAVRPDRRKAFRLLPADA